MNIKEEIRYKSGIKSSLYLMEGIHFFKSSVSLYRLTDQLKKMLETKKILDKNDAQQIGKMAISIRKLADRFKMVEEEYELGNKQDAISSYNDLKVRLKNTLNGFNVSTSMKKLIISSGFLLSFFEVLVALKLVSPENYYKLKRKVVSPVQTEQEIEEIYDTQEELTKNMVSIVGGTSGQ